MTIISETKSMDKLPSNPKLSGALQTSQMKHINLIKPCLIVLGTALLGTVLTGCMTLGGI